MTALIARQNIDGSKPDTAQGVNVANFQLGLGNAWDCLQTLGVGLSFVSAGAAVLTQANAGLVLIDASAGNVTLTAPAASAAIGALFQYKRVDATANLVTIQRAGTDTIDGQTSLSLVGQYDYAEMRSDGVSAWRPLNALANPQRSRDLIGAGVLSFRNKLRNPKGEIAQRGTSINFAAGTGGSYTIDGWRYDHSTGAGAVNVSQGAGLLSTEFQTSIRVQVTTANGAPAAGNNSVLSQPIEGYLVRDLIGNPIALRFEVTSPKSGTHCVALRNVGSDRSYVMTYSVAAANTAQLVTLALPAGLITAGTWNWTNGVGVQLMFPLMAGATFQTAAGAWTVGNFFATAAQQNLLDTIGNVFAITGVQLEKGGASTPFEHRDPALELLLNQRYYEIVFAHQFTTQTAGGIVSAIGPMKVPKRGSISLGAVSVSSSESNFTYTTALVDAWGNALFYGTATASGGVEVQRNAPLISEL